MVTNQQAHGARRRFALPVAHATGIKGKEYSPTERRKGKGQEENLLGLPETNFTCEGLKDLVNIME